jgi:photosystem II stability/assembly factor-like uncharacterized protein
MKIGGVAQARSGDLVAVTCFTGEAWTSRDGVRWQNQGRLGGYQALWFLEADPKTGYLYTGGEGEEGIYESRDDGRTWTSLGLRHGEGYRGNSTAAVFNGRGELIVARGGRRAYLHRRVGDRWEPSSKGVPMRPPVFGLERINGVLILSCGGKIYTSVDEGESWQSGAQEIAARIERIGPGPGGTLLMFSLDGLYEAKVRGASR